MQNQPSNNKTTIITLVLQSAQFGLSSAARYLRKTRTKENGTLARILQAANDGIEAYLDDDLEGLEEQELKQLHAAAQANNAENEERPRRRADDF